MNVSLQKRIEECINAVEKKYGKSAKKLSFNPAIQEYINKNQDMICLSYALLSLFEDLKPFALEHAIGGNFDLRKEYGIDPCPLYNLNSPDVTNRVVREIFGKGVEEIEIDHELVLRDLYTIRDNRLLGAHTGGKLAYIQAIAKKPLRELMHNELEGVLLPLQEKTIDLLRRQADRMARDKTDVKKVEEIIYKIRHDFLLYSLEELFSEYPQFENDGNKFFQVYADEIAQILGDHLGGERKFFSDGLSKLKFIRGKGIEVAFTPRTTEQFVFSGDYYGECTAYEARTQVDPEIANIHWTVYSWLLDPYYNILDIFYDGEKVLKGHLLPLIIHRKKVLMLDAIEVVPKLRKYLRGRENKNLSERLYERKEALLEKLFETTKELAEKMGVEAIYVDKFSNATWVREKVDKLPADGYHIKEVKKPFDLGILKNSLRDILGLEGNNTLEEVQAWNLALMDQELKYGHKEVGVLMGRRKDYNIPVRGI